MLKLHSIIIATVTITALTACSQMQPICPKPKQDFLDNPNSNGVAYYQKNQQCIYPRSVKLDPNLTNVHYCAMGKISVNNHNSSGLERQRATVDDLLRERAAALGGNAVIQITRDKVRTYGTAALITKK